MLLFHSCLLTMKRNSNFHDPAYTKRNHIGIVFLLLNLLKCFFCKSVKFIRIFAMLKFKDKARIPIVLREQLNIESSISGFTVGANMIAVIHYCTQPKHHTVIETLICTIKR